MLRLEAIAHNTAELRNTIGHLHPQSAYPPDPARPGTDRKAGQTSGPATPTVAKPPGTEILSELNLWNRNTEQVADTMSMDVGRP